MTEGNERQPRLLPAPGPKAAARLRAHQAASVPLSILTRGMPPGGGDLRWLQVELQDPDGVALGVLEPRGRPAANIRDAVDGLQPRKVVLLEDDAT
jgi:hypothetical protein